MHPDASKIAEVRTKGFAIVEQIIPPQAVAALRELLQTCIDEDLEKWQGQPYQDAWMVHNLMVRGLPFAHLMENELLQAYLSELLGDTCILYAYTSSSMPPKGTNYSRRIHVDCPRVIEGYITNVGVMIILDDFTPQNGATYFLPHSFQRTEPPMEEEFVAAAEQLYPQAGDAVVFNARTWHRGGVNETDAPRHAVTMNVCRSYMRQRFDYPRLVDPEIVAQLGEVGKRFLGFNVRVPTSLEEYYLPEEQRLYKANQG
jgi:ectoine hydroxylase-related dioxygenase (phytanoyl-CoA dioxygenase family)